MLKKASVLTRPTPARRDAPCPRRGRISIHFRGGWDDPNCASASRAASNLPAVLRAGGLAASDCARPASTLSTPARNDQSCVRDARAREAAWPPHARSYGRDARAGGISLAATPLCAKKKGGAAGLAASPFCFRL